MACLFWGCRGVLELVRVTNTKLSEIGTCRYQIRYPCQRMAIRAEGERDVEVAVT